MVVVKILDTAYGETFDKMIFPEDCNDIWHWMREAANQMEQCKPSGSSLIPSVQAPRQSNSKIAFRGTRFSINFDNTSHQQIPTRMHVKGGYYRDTADVSEVQQNTRQAFPIEILTNNFGSSSVAHHVIEPSCFQLKHGTPRDARQLFR